MNRQRQIERRFSSRSKRLVPKKEIPFSGLTKNERIILVIRLRTHLINRFRKSVTAQHILHECTNFNRNLFHVSFKLQVL